MGQLKILGLDGLYDHKNKPKKKNRVEAVEPISVNEYEEKLK